ncbi:MAG: hypothetical protein C0490_21860, partial [Marivirga sp.]|nr:hypothetical protein [Marivirga sp.]
KEGLKLHPDDARLNLQAGLTYLSLPNKSESLRYLQTAFTLNPKVDENIYYYLGLSYQSNKQFKSAQEFFSEYKKRNKGQAEFADKKIRQSQFADSLTRIPTDVIVENVGSAINSAFHEYSPLVSADGNTMIFTSTRPDEASGSSFSKFEDIYISKRLDGQWSKPVKISPNINIEFNDAAASLSPDGKTLVLYYEYGGGDIYVSKSDGSGWTKPTPLNENINSPLSWETSAFLTDDGRQLYFTSNRPEGYGNLDIYVSEMEQTGDWGKANNLGPVINTPGKEDSPAVDPDGRTLYFSSDGHPTMGGTDIFKSEFKDGKWQKPVNLGYPINSVEDDSFFAFTQDRRRAYFSTLREEGNAEIYTLTFIEPEREIAQVINPVPETRSPAREPVIAESIQDNSENNQAAKQSREDYAKSQTNATLNNGLSDGRKFLFFDVGKDELKAVSVSKLKDIAAFLSSDHEVKILIEGHTDNTGSDILNQALSIKRANAVAKYLTRNAIDPQRITLKAYGSKRPLVSNDD